MGRAASRARAWAPRGRLVFEGGQPIEFLFGPQVVHEGDAQIAAVEVVRESNRCASRQNVGLVEGRALPSWRRRRVQMCRAPVDAGGTA